MDRISLFAVDNTCVRTIKIKKESLNLRGSYSHTCYKQENQFIKHQFLVKLKKKHPFYHNKLLSKNRTARISYSVIIYFFYTMKLL